MTTDTTTTGRPGRGNAFRIGAWAVAAVTTALALGCIVLEIAGPATPRASADPSASSGGVILVTIHCVVAASFAVLGAIVVSRQPRNPVGWILSVIGFSFICIAVSNQVYLRVVLATGEAPGIVPYVVWLGNWAWIPAMIPAFTFLPLLFPTGQPLSPRWRPLVWFVGAAALALAGSAFAPGPLAGSVAVRNPMGIDHTAIQTVSGIGGVCLFPAALASIASLVVRFRRSSGVERQQLKWVASAAALLPVAGLFPGDTSWPLILIALLIVAIAVSVAMLRYRLYDIDVVINKAVVFVVLAVFITGVYAAVVVGLGRLLPVGEGNLGLSIAATAVVAVVFEPVRVRVQHWANRLVYGRRASPYETLAAMTERIGDAADPGDALSEAARLLAEGTGAAQAVVWVAQDGLLIARASAGDVVGDPAPVRLDAGKDLPVLAGTALVQPVRHEGKLVGALSLAKRPGEGVNSTDRRLVEELAGQAALLLANTRLRSRLSDRLVELRASRQRMLTAQDLARHALERDLHDGAQQELVALKIKLGLARTIAIREGDTTTAAQLAETVLVADEAVETLREVARGIYPPLLESEGLSAALSAQARRVDLAVTVLDRGIARYPRDVEATAYFCALEALHNAERHAQAGHAHIELDADDANLTVTVTDDGTGFDPGLSTHGEGLTHMADRADAAGDTLTITSQPGHGTTITLTLPVR